MIKDFIEQFLFFPNNEIKRTPDYININYIDVYLDYKDDKYHGWFIEGNNTNSISKNKCILFFSSSLKSKCFLS